MRNLFALLRKMAGLAAVLGVATGVATMARKDTDPSPDRPSEPDEPVLREPAAHLLEAVHPTELKPGWNKPLPEKIPNPTYWPALFAFGLMFIFWGIISNIFLLCLGFILAVIAVIGWVSDLRHEYSE
jgi:hypothetical protein